MRPLSVVLHTLLTAGNTICRVGSVENNGRSFLKNNCNTENSISSKGTAACSAVTSLYSFLVQNLHDMICAVRILPKIRKGISSEDSGFMLCKHQVYTGIEANIPIYQY